MRNFNLLRKIKQEEKICESGFPCQRTFSLIKYVSRCWLPHRAIFVNTSTFKKVTVSDCIEIF